MAADDRFSADFREPRDDEPPGTRSEIITGPVTDWATDFSHLEPEWSADPYPIQDDLRQRCPIAHTRRFGGAWLPTRYADVAAIAYDTDRFSSRSIIVGNLRPPRELAPIGGSPPISSDPPFHHHARKLLLPAFTKAAVTRQEPATRALCHALIDGFGDAGVLDAARDYAQHIPVRVIAGCSASPRRTARSSVSSSRTCSRASTCRRRSGIPGSPGCSTTCSRRSTATWTIRATTSPATCWTPRSSARSSTPRTSSAPWRCCSSRASTRHGARSGPRCGTWPRLRKTGGGWPRSPGLLPAAVEELLRAYAPVTMARLVKEDMHWHGADMKADDWILLSFPAANRDPAQFGRAGEVVIDREANRHAAFGLGIHRCIGSHLARMELRVALEVWLERTGEFSLADPAAVTWATGQIRGPRTLPLRIRWPPSPGEGGWPARAGQRGGL